MVATAKDYSKLLGYSPSTQTNMRRSQYLADALKSIGDSSNKVTGGWGELGARLIATALLKRGSDKADANLLTSMKGDQDRESAMWMQGLTPPDVPTAPPPSSLMGDAPPAPFTPPAPQTPAPPPPDVQSQPLQAAYAPQDLDALTRMIATEAIGEGPTGMAAAAHVALNRLNTGYGGAKSLSEVVNAPNQFEGMSRAGQVKPEEYAAARKIAEDVVAGRVADPTGGAINFLNPDLQAQLGRPQPSWAPEGQGQRIGRHVFYGGQGGPAMAANVPPPPALPAQNLAQAGPIADQPFQVAAAGGLQPGMIPSAPAVSPVGGGAAPAAAPPQAAAAGAWPTWKPSGAEIDQVQALLANPRTHDAGVQMAMKMRQKMAQPVEAEVVNMNGRSFYVPKVPGQAPTIAIPVPPEAMTQVVDARTFNPYAAQGVMAQRDPMGNLKEAPGSPPQGYSANPGGSLMPQQGGPADPYRPQAPAQGYQYTGPGQQQATPGGPADPRAPSNYIAEVGKLQDNIAPIVQDAVKLKRSVDSVRTGYAQQNGPGDIAMINGLQRMIDEGVVREGDVALQLRGQGIAGGLAGVKGYLTSEGFFADPKIRTQLLNVANGLYGEINGTYRDRVMGYRGMTERLLGAGAFDDVFSPDTAASLGWTDKPANTPPPPQPGAGGVGKVRVYNPKSGKLE